MDLETSLAIYLIIWWVVLFSILPLGVVSHAEAGVKTPGGGDPASPGAAPFSAWERAIAVRYLRARRQEGGVALISVISFVGIALAVSVLIIVISVMNGFRSDLGHIMLSFNPHAQVYGGETASAN